VCCFELSGVFGDCYLSHNQILLEPEISVRKMHKWAADLSVELKQMIRAKGARDQLLRPASILLRDVKATLVPNALKASPAYALMWFEMAEFRVPAYTRRKTVVKHAQDMIPKCGEDAAAVE
jgi:hypothetical protein